MRITATNPRVALIVASFVVVGCTPTFESHIDSPPMPALGSPSQSVQQCPPVEPAPIKLAPLDPRPQLPDAEQSPCPPESGLYACFMVDQDIARQKRFKMLHDDREYCRDAYDRAVKRAETNR